MAKVSGRRKKPKYLTQPEITLPCCSLLVALNALRYMGHKTPGPGDPAFEYLVDLADCREHGATNMSQAWAALGLCVERGPHRLAWISARVNNGFPVAVVGQFKDNETHMGLVIGVEGRQLEIVNWYIDEPVSKIKFEEIIQSPAYEWSAFAFSYPGYHDLWY